MMKQTIFFLCCVLIISVNAQDDQQVLDNIKKSYLIESGKNLVNNESFELANNKKISNWNYDASVYSLSKRESYRGESSLKYENYDASKYKFCSQVVPIHPGNKYKFSCYVKTENISGDGFGATITLQWNDKNGKWMGGSYPKGVVGTKDWTLIEDVAEIPNDASSAYITCYVRKGMTGKAWFDEVKVEKLDNPELNVYLLEPHYRGILDNDYNSIRFNVSLTDYDKKLTKLKIKTELINPQNNRIITSKKLKLDKNKKTFADFGIRGLINQDYLLKTYLLGENDIILESNTIELSKKSNVNKRKIHIDKHKRTIVDGKPFFPLGMYWSKITEDDLKVFSDSKFNTIMPYGEQEIKELNLAEKFGIKVIYSVKSFYHGVKYSPPEIKDEKSAESYLINKVNVVKEHPALLAWYLADELGPEMIPVMENHYDIIKSLDENHPVWIVLNRTENLLDYFNTFDVFGSDPYPVGREKTVSLAGKWTIDTRKSLLNSRALWMVPQVHNLRIYNQDFSLGGTPTYDQMRSMAWQTITEGAMGIVFYSFFDLRRNPEEPFNIKWNEVKMIAEEINSFVPVLLSIDNAPDVKVEPVNGKNNWFHSLIKKYENDLYIFVVNNGEAAGKVKITLPLEKSKVYDLNRNELIESDEKDFTVELPLLQMKPLLIKKE